MAKTMINTMTTVLCRGGMVACIWPIGLSHRFGYWIYLVLILFLFRVSILRIAYCVLRYIIYAIRNTQYVN